MNDLFFSPGGNFLGAINLKIVLSAVLLDIFTFFMLPGMNLLTYLAVAITVDFVTGCLKTLMHNPKDFSSSKARSSVTKVFQYFGAVAVVLMISSMTTDTEHKVTVEFVVNAVYTLLIVIEIISILENFRDMDPNSVISKTIFSPLLKYLGKRVKAAQAAIPGAEAETPIEPTPPAEPQAPTTP